MDHYHLVYLIIALLCLLPVTICAYFVVQSKKRARQRQRCEESQANRERLAAERIAKNGGQALSARLATSDASRQNAERSV